MNAADPPPIRPDGQSCEAAAVRTAPLALWRVAEAFLGVLNALFGAPQWIAAQHTLTAKAHGQLASWLRCAEAMLRRLLLIEAGAYPKPNTRPLLRTRCPRARKPVLFYPDTPEDWRVSFRCFAGDTHARRAARQDERSMAGACVSPKRFRSAWPLALRYQALIRVFNDPTTFARRLSARLHATPHRLREVLHAPPEARHRVDHFDDLSEHAEIAWRPHFSSA